VPDWAEIPFVFLTTEIAIENKIRGLELGVEDYLTKPIYIKEIVTRINILLQKRQRAGFDERKDGMRFAGRVADMPVVDVIQTIEVSRKSGIIQFVASNNRQAAIYFRDGKVIDAEAGTLQGEDAVYRLLTWSDGDFEVVFRTVRRREAISTTSQGLLMEGMRRLDEWTRLLEQLPPLAHRFEVDITELAVRLGEVPDHNNRILRLIDGKRSLLEVIDASDFGDLECLQTIARLFFEGLLLDLDPDVPAQRDTGKPMPLVVVDEAPSPMEAVVNRPIEAVDMANATTQLVPVDAFDSPPASAPIPAATAQVERTDSIPADDQVLEEQAAEDYEESAEPEPLLGAYRPSSLRLIDEAVAAAQLIEPSLFDGPDAAPAALAKVQLEKREPDPRVVTARGLVEKARGPNGTNGSARSLPTASSDTNNSGVPTAIEGDDSGSAGRRLRERDEFDDDDDAAIQQGFSTTLRMIGSLGRDHAEASGEVRLPSRTSEGSAVEPARELVTIMPRRKTGEFPVLPSTQAERAKAVAAATATGAAVVPAAAAAAADAAAPAGGSTPAAPPAPKAAAMPAATSATGLAPDARPAAESPRRASQPRLPTGGGVRRRVGPGPAAATLIIAASMLSGASAYMYCHKRISSHHAAPIVAGDAGGSGVASGSGMIEIADARQVAVAPPDARQVAVAPPDAPQVVVAPPDAALARAPADAAQVAVAARDAGPSVVEPPVDRKKLAADLATKAHAALEDGDPDRALELANQSLALRRTQRTLLEKARALQRLGRIDDSVKALDEAIDIDTKASAPWEQKALVLWAAHRTDEARAAMQKYLELEPDGHSAEMFRHLLENK
jgi:hypothetical protein